MNVSRLITLALRLSGITGVGQTASADDTADALDYLNGMIGQWSRSRWLNTSLIDVSFPATGEISYTVGPGQSVNIQVPDRVEYAYARLLSGTQPIDYPLVVLQAPEDYASVGIKGLQSFPATIYYDSAWPVAKLFVHPIASAQFEMHILVKSGFTAFGPTDTINLPPEYTDALLYGLGERLAVNYGVGVGPGVSGLYKAALNGIRIANTQIAELQIPRDLLGRTGTNAVFGAFAGQTYFQLDGSNLG